MLPLFEVNNHCHKISSGQKLIPDRWNIVGKVSLISLRTKSLTYHKDLNRFCRHQCKFQYTLAHVLNALSSEDMLLRSLRACEHLGKLYSRNSIVIYSPNKFPCIKPLHHVFVRSRFHVGGHFLHFITGGHGFSTILPKTKWDEHEKVSNFSRTRVARDHLKFFQGHFVVLLSLRFYFIPTWNIL